MALRSVLTIDVDDSAFRQFSDAFHRYEQAVARTPSAWQKVRDAVSGQASQLDKATEATGAIGHQASSQASAWRAMSRNAKSFAGHIADATRSLLRWTALTGVISGVLGGGGLFGIERLAQSAASQRRSSSGLGVTPGEEKAFNLNYGRLVDAPNVLGSVSSALLDPSKRSALYGAGLSEGDLQGKDAAQVSVEAISAIKRLVDQTPRELLGALGKSRRLDDLGFSEQDLQRIKDRPADEVHSYRQGFNRDSSTLDLRTEQQKAWEDLKVQLDRAGATIKNTFIVGLTPLAPSLEKLSKSFTHLVEVLLKNPLIEKWINDLAKSLENFAKYVGTPEFDKKINMFIEDVGKLGAAIGKAFSAVVAWVNWFRGENGEGVGGGAGIGNADKTDNPSTATTGRGDLENRDDARVPGSPAQQELRRQQKAAERERQGLPPEPPAQGWGDWLKDRWYNGPDRGDPRGIRNNNPLNLSYAGQEGATSDGRFARFGSLDEGVTADAKQLITYQDRDHLNTVQSIIGKWAPSSENDTSSYAKSVSERLHVKPTDTIDLHNRDTLRELIAAMAKVENGREIDRSAIDRGVSRAVPTQAASNNTNKQVSINITNATGGNAVVSASQLAI